MASAVYMYGRIHRVLSCGEASLPPAMSIVQGCHSAASELSHFRDEARAFSWIVFCAPLFGEAVADTPDGHDLVADRAQLLAQPHDVRIHRAVNPVVVVAP
jgi:hypothetical protein